MTRDSRETERKEPTQQQHPGFSSADEAHLQVHNLARELVRTLKQAADYATRIDKARGQVLQSELGPMDLSQKLAAMAQNVCHEFFDGKCAEPSDAPEP